MWSTGNFKTSEDDAASRKSLFGRGSYLWLPSLDGNSKVEFYNWSNVEFTASGHTTLSKWASCFSWAKAFVNNLQSDFKPNQLTKHGTRASRSGGGLRWPEAEAVWKAQCYIPVTAAPLQLYLAHSGTPVWRHWGLGLGDPPYPMKAERRPRAWIFLCRCYPGMKKTSKTQLQVMCSQLNPIWAVWAAKIKLEIQTDGNPSKMYVILFPKRILTSYLKLCSLLPISAWSLRHNSK